MKRLLTLALLLLLTTPALAIDVPAYRASWTATGADPTVAISSPQTGDAILLFVVSSNHNGTGDHPTASDDQSGTYSGTTCTTIWKQGSKWAPFEVLVRDQVASSTTAIAVDVDTQGKDAVVIAVAISGLTLWDSASPLQGCGSLFGGGSVRMVKATQYCANCGGDNPIESGTTPLCPKAGTQTTAFVSTSLTLAVLANEDSSPGVTAPSGWTQRATASSTSQGKTVALNVTSRDSGFSGSTVTWGSTTPTDGATMLVEIQPLQ